MTGTAALAAVHAVLDLSPVVAIAPTPTVAANIGDFFASTAFSGSMLLAIPIALLAGLISFASPCVVPLVPGYVGFLGGLAGAQAGATLPAADAQTAAARSTNAQLFGQRSPANSSKIPPQAGGKRRVLLGMALFVLGFTVVFVITGVLTGATGAALARWSETITRVLGLVVILMGVAFMGAIPALQNERRLHALPTTGLWGAPVLGFVFGLGWTPCLGPTLVAINALALNEGSTLRGAILAVCYSLGLGLPFLLIALGIERSAWVLGFLRRHRRAVMRIGGGLLIVLGIALVTGLWGTLSSWMSSWIGSTGTVV